jgi:hypothetical protein
MTSESTRAIAADIAREFKDHPERWKQGSFGFRESGGACLDRHITSRCNDRWDGLASVVCAHMGFASRMGLWNWNDAPDRTVHDIIALCEKVAANG